MPRGHERRTAGTVVNHVLDPSMLYYITTEPGTVIRIHTATNQALGTVITGLETHDMMYVHSNFWEEHENPCPAKIRKYVPEGYRA